MTDFFELARSTDLDPTRSANVFRRWRKGEIVDFVESAADIVSAASAHSPSPYGFIANTTLSGGASPCSAIGCRLPHAAELAQFAALYSDRVVIQNPFSRYSKHIPAPILREQLQNDLVILWHLEPLMRAGLIQVAAPSVSMCPTCSALARAEERRVDSLLDDAADAIVARFLPRLRFDFALPGRVLIEGPEELLEHGGQSLGMPARLFAKRRTRRAREELARRLLVDILRDISVQQWHAGHYNLNYWTDRTLSVEIIESINGRRAHAIGSALSRGLSHAVPVLHTVDTATLLKLRSEEGAAFEAYREAVARVLRNADLTTVASANEAFADAIRPELAKVNASVVNARKMGSRAVKRDIVLGSATLGIGLFLGFLEPTARALLASFGGLQALRGVANAAMDMAEKDPPVARESSYYFLWRLQSAQPLKWTTKP